MNAAGNGEIKELTGGIYDAVGNISFISLSASTSHTCAITREIGKVQCWGPDGSMEGNMDGESDAPKLAMRVEPSCATEHPQKFGPTVVAIFTDHIKTQLSMPAGLHFLRSWHELHNH